MQKIETGWGFKKIWLALLITAFLLSPTVAQNDDTVAREWCIEIKEKYGIIPGQSFGTLPKAMETKYLRAKCFRFFCEPHPKAGKGVFKCIPLVNDHS